MSLCQQCVSFCACGKPKDHRAAECQSCGMSRKAKAQWSDPVMRERIHNAVIKAGRRRRTTFDLLTWESFKDQKQQDGRFYTRYWDGDAHRYIYRSRWVWQKANGPIPDGMEIHHINEDPTDDRLENLEMLTTTAHQSHHMASGRAMEMVAARGDSPRVTDVRSCAACKTDFVSTFRSDRNSFEKFCSRKCADVGLIKRPRTPCAHCGETFQPTQSKGLKFCSRKCYEDARSTTVVMDCPTCGISFEHQSHKGRPRKFCSSKCFRHTSTIWKSKTTAASS